jgi:hypothetical protein
MARTMSRLCPPAARRPRARALAAALGLAFALGACSGLAPLGSEPTAADGIATSLVPLARGAPASPGGPADANGTEALARLDLLDARTCRGCHAQAYDEWADSPHAQAADDPVFLAMNRMAQRETHGAIGSFCVQCHAPMALREGATVDGLNLADVPRQLKGVTCYFCHDAKSVAGSHNNGVQLAGSMAMRGPLHDAQVTHAHTSVYSPLHDRNTLASSSLCGSCHDVVTPPGAKLESTFAEWQASVYAHRVTGQSCSGCHMPQGQVKQPVADEPNAPLRYRHAHDFPGLSMPMAQAEAGVQQGPAGPAAPRGRRSLDRLLDGALQSALCVREVGGKASLRVILDNVGAGHALTSGAVQDRRLWVEVVAYRHGRIIYQSGAVPEGEPVMHHLDPDLWLVRSCMFDAEGRPTKHFWQAASIDSNPLPTLSTFNPADPAFYRTHLVRAYPQQALATLDEVPDRVTMRVLIEPIGLDLLDELVATGDLAPQHRARAQRLEVGAHTLEWTAKGVNTGYQEHGVPLRCVTQSNINLTGPLTPAPTHQRCAM